jgi:biopolymer transport protein TolR
MPAVSSRGRGRRTISEPNMVPFIDVMLVLLIIFMVTAPLITPSMIDLPSIGKAAKQPDVVIQIILGKNDALEMKVKENSTPVTLSSLAEKVQQAQKKSSTGAEVPNTAVVISADKTVKYESVVKVMDTLQRAGIARVGLSVQLVN